MTSRLFTVQALLERLESCCGIAHRELVVGFSGGLDSTVLLHALLQIRTAQPWQTTQIKVVHVNHRLQQQADDWQAHCESVCESLGVDCLSVVLDSSPAEGENLEAWARQQRYAALSQFCDTDSCLITAHHQDDQCETLLLNLLRGSGPHGLSSIPDSRPLDQSGTLLCRPLLSFSRRALEGYAQQQGLSWIDDPSNRDLSYDRNYLRHRLLPVMQEHWPAYAASLQQTTDVQSEVASLLDEVAEQDLCTITGHSINEIRLPAFQALSSLRQENVLRFWFRKQGRYVPARKQIVALREQVVDAAIDAQPQLKMGDTLVRRYRDTLYFEADTVRPQCSPCEWDLNQSLTISAGVFRAERRVGQGVACHRVEADRLQVKFRQGGERCRPANRQGTQSLKKIFQERAVPGWQRDQLPLFYIDGDLVAVADYFVCEGYQADADEAGWCIQWEKT